MKKEQTFAETIFQYKDTWFRIAMGIAKNESDAEDIVCESILKAYEKQQTLRKENSFKSWMNLIGQQTHPSVEEEFRIIIYPFGGAVMYCLVRNCRNWRKECSNRFFVDRISISYYNITKSSNQQKGKRYVESSRI